MSRTPQDEATVPVSRRPSAPTSRELLVMTSTRQWREPLPASGDVVIGRATDCAVIIDEPSISRRHALIRVGSTLTVTDLGGINGVEIAGHRGQVNVAVTFEPGDVLDLGTVQIVVVDRSAATQADDATPPARNPSRSAEPTDFVSTSASMTRLMSIVDRIAVTDLSVLVHGETGVGKERIAEAIHRRSRRSGGPLVKLNCAALAPTLVENELFGHERGAFTGASDSKRGLIEAAQRGTLFLDEVGELPLNVQAKLLRVLEERVVLPVGGTQPRKVDVRIVSATHRDLRTDITAGRFREDLFFRLNGITVSVPPLRERSEEIVLLARHFADIAAASSQGRPVAWGDDVANVLRAYHWPGNVRELRNAIERAVALSTTGHLSLEDLPSEVVAAARPSALRASAPAMSSTTDDVAPAARTFRSDREEEEKQRILTALERCGGNQTQAAADLGMPRRTLVARLKAYGYVGPRKRTRDED